MIEPPKSYLDIGHGGERAFIWIECGAEIETRNADKWTHETAFGSAATRWRGRYDCATKRLSIAPPLSNFRGAIKKPRAGLVDKLRKKFGEIEIWMCPTFDAPYLIPRDTLAPVRAGYMEASE